MSGNSWTGLLVAMGCDNNLNSSSASASNMSSTMPSGTTGNAMTGPALNGSSGSGMNGTSTDMTGASATGVTQTPTATNGQTSTPAPAMARASTPVQSDTYGSGNNPDRNNVNNTGTSDRNSDINAGRGTADRTTGEAGVSASTDQNLPRSTASAGAGNNGNMSRATDYTAGMRTNTSDTAQNTGGSDRSGWDQAKMVAGQLGASCRISQSTSSFALRLPNGQLIPFDSASNAKVADQLRSHVSADSGKIFRVVVQGTMNGGTMTVDSIRM